MNPLKDFQTVSKSLHGKRLPTEHYLYRPCETEVPTELWLTLRRAELAASPDIAWNILKLHTDQFAVSFLSYPDFDTDPHPALVEATKINLNSGTVVRTSYINRSNPPILHRKETFLPATDARAPTFSALTRKEEEAGLYRDPSRIGLRVHWFTLLRRLGLKHDGHTLVAVKEAMASVAEDAVSPEVARHRTAIKRYDLSKPLKQLLERGLLRKTDTFFDYGCGHGMDVEALENLGYQASGWDPAFRPNALKTPADVVNLGYVLNVIDDPAERIATLRAAFALSKRLLAVATLVAGQESSAHSKPYRDGFLTKANTFQKFYAPGELETLIENTLDVEVITLGLGLCLVFRDENQAELFESNRNRRRIDWTEISAQLRFSVPVGRQHRMADRYDLHQQLFDEFWRVLLDLGRAPEPGEFDRLTEVSAAGGGIKRATALVTHRNGEKLWQETRKERTEDVLVYLAMTKFRKRFLRREIPLRTRNDIRSFFGDISAALQRSNEILFSAGDPGEIELACEGLGIGWHDEESLTFHRSLLDRLPPILRIYVHCAAHRYGDPYQADLIKIHKYSGKVTFQHYDDFEGKALPALKTRIKVNLRNLFVEVFDHSALPKVQLLYFKERFVPNDHPGREKMVRFSERLRKLGLNEATLGFGPDRETFLGLLDNANLTESLLPRKRRP